MRSISGFREGRVFIRWIGAIGRLYRFLGNVECSLCLAVCIKHGDGMLSRRQVVQVIRFEGDHGAAAFCRIILRTYDFAVHLNTGEFRVGAVGRKRETCLYTFFLLTDIALDDLIVAECCQ